MSADPRECPHCGDIPSPWNQCCCGYIMPRSHEPYVAGLERENARLRLLEVELESERKARLSAEEACTEARRWEIGFRNIVTRTIGPRAPFEIPQVVNLVGEAWAQRDRMYVSQGDGEGVTGV